MLNETRSRAGLLCSAALLIAIASASCSDDDGRTSGAGGGGGEGGEGGGSGGGGGGGDGGGGAAGSSTGAMTGSSSSSGGGELPCKPFQLYPCYTGPAGTEGVGLCHGGVHECLGGGMTFGPCQTEVTPSAETCLTAFDDDCDGQLNEDGAGCVCVPMSTAPCYPGPPATRDVGACRDGIQTCNPLGTDEGACLGFVLPRGEDCLTSEDEDCDGITPSCPTLFSKSYGRPQSDAGRAVAFDSAGALLLTGYVAASGPVDFGGGPLASAKPNGGGANAFLVKLDQSGAHVWSKRFNDPDEDDAQSAGEALAIDANDNIFMAGELTGKIDFGGGFLQPMGGAAFFVTKLSPAGQHVYSSMITTSFDAAMHGLGIDPAGNAVVTGGYETYIDFGSGPIQSPVLDGKADLFMVKLDPSGGVAWSKATGAAGTQYGSAVALDTAGNAALAAYVEGSVDLGAGPVTVPNNLLIAKLDPGGSPLWTKPIGCGTPLGIGVDAAGDIVVTGVFQNTCDFGGVQLTSVWGYDGFVMKLDGSGQTKWARQIGGIGYDAAESVAITGTGNIVLAVQMELQLDAGCGEIRTNGGLSDVAVVILDPAGSCLYSQRFGDLQYQYPYGVAAGPAGRVAVTGALQSQIDFGLGPLTSVGVLDVFVAALKP